MATLMGMDMEDMGHMEAMLAPVTPDMDMATLAMQAAMLVILTHALKLLLLLHIFNTRKQCRIVRYNHLSKSGFVKYDPCRIQYENLNHENIEKTMWRKRDVFSCSRRK